MRLDVNHRAFDVPAAWRDESLLQVLREAMGLVGPKFGCGAGLTPGAAAGGKPIKTIEGLAPAGQLHPVQQTWLQAALPQCGYCQSGQIMATVALFERTLRPTDSQINEALAGHLCRCGTQPRVRAALQEMAKGA